MDDHSSSELQEYLAIQEKLVWSAQPKQGVVFRLTDIFLIPFSLLWCGFAIFWLITAVQSGAPFFFSLFGIPFVVIGLIFVFGRFIIDAKQRKHTIYGLTNERIIIKSGILKKSIKSLNVRTLSDIECDEKRDGSGTITIGAKHPMMTMWNGMNWWPGVKTVPALDMIPDVRQVYNKIVELQNSK